MKQKRNISLISLIAFVVGMSSFWYFVEVQAQFNSQGAAIDAFTYFVPYPTERLDDQFDNGFAGANLIGEDIETVISISVHRGDSIIYYDHWEDGLEINLTAPIQPSTQIWGDNNPTNGLPPGFADDTLNAGDVIVLRNLVALDDAGSRDRDVIFFDGGDLFTSIGGAIAVTVAVWPEGPSTLFAGAWELYPTNRWGTDYRIPIGTELAVDRPGFTEVGINVQAVQDNTTVELDLDAMDGFEQTVILNQGEQFTGIDGIRVGARVQASGPVQVHLLAANPASEFEARAYTIVPLDQWTDDILAPLSSDGDFWLYNPDPDEALEIMAQTFTSTTVLTVSANSTIKFPSTGLSGPGAVRFTSGDGRPLFGVAALDENDSQDWGYALQPVDRLTTQVLVGWAPGNNRIPPSPDPDVPDSDGFESQVYVTAVTATTINVDYDVDGSVDATFPVSPLAEVAITDPGDFDMTGAFLFSDDGAPFMAVWGQDENAPIAQPSIDVGTSFVPLPSLLVQKTFVPTDTDCTGNANQGDTIQFRLQYFNNSVNTISDVLVEDDLPTAVSYVPDSSTLNGAQIPDDTGTQSPFPFDEGGYKVGAVELLSVGSLNFDVVIEDDSNPIINRAEISSAGLPLGSDFVIVFTPAEEATPLIEIDLLLVDPDNGVVTIGDIITFSLTITNTGDTAIIKLPVQNMFNEDHLTFLEANPPPDTITPGVIGWDDLTNGSGLAIAEAVSATVSFSIDQIPPDNTIILRATALEVEFDNNQAPLICSTETSLTLESDGKHDDGTTTVTVTPTATVTPTPTVTPSPTVTATLTPELPVAFLPETGTTETVQTNWVPLGLPILLLSLAGISLGSFLLWKRLRKRVLEIEREEKM